MKAEPRVGPSVRGRRWQVQVLVERRQDSHRPPEEFGADAWVSGSSSADLLTSEPGHPPRPGRIASARTRAYAPAPSVPTPRAGRSTWSRNATAESQSCESSGSPDRTRCHFADVQHGSTATALHGIDSHRPRWPIRCPDWPEVIWLPTGRDEEAVGSNPATPDCKTAGQRHVGAKRHRPDSREVQQRATRIGCPEAFLLTWSTGIDTLLDPRLTDMDRHPPSMPSAVVFGDRCRAPCPMTSSSAGSAARNGR